MHVYRGLSVNIYWACFLCLALMNSDDMPLSIYGLRPGCYITLKLDTSKAHHNKEVRACLCDFL